MASIDLQFSPAQIRSAEDRLNGIKNGLPVAMAGAINDTAKQGKTKISSKIRDRVNIKKQDLDKNIKIFPNATPSNLKSGLHLAKTERLKLGYFGARQTAVGVTYGIMKGGGRKQILHAFGPKIARLGNQVWMRTGQWVVPTQGRYAGKFYTRGPKKGQPVMRESITGPKRGLSAWGVVVKNNMLPDLKLDIGKDLSNNLERRVHFLVLKRSGAI